MDAQPVQISDGGPCYIHLSSSYTNTTKYEATWALDPFFTARAPLWCYLLLPISHRLLASLMADTCDIIRPCLTYKIKSDISCWGVMSPLSSSLQTVHTSTGRDNGVGIMRDGVPLCTFPYKGVRCGERIFSHLYPVEQIFRADIAGYAAVWLIAL